MAEEKINTDVLSRKIQEGMATKEERGIALKTLNTQMAVELIGKLDNIKKQNVGLSRLRGLLADKLTKKGEEAVKADELDLHELLTFVQVLTDMELKTADIYRKILQGNRMLFDEDSMSEQQQIVVRLLNSFETNEQKRDFLKLATNFVRQKEGGAEEAQVIDE
jgi:hypothetical protein